jgi:hypothetical protein
LGGFKPGEGGGKSGEPNENRCVQREHYNGGLGERQQSKAVNMAAEDAQRYDTLLAKIGGVVRAYGD